MKKTTILLLLILTCLFCQSQNVGIGVTTPVARLHVSDSNVLFTGPGHFVNYNPPQLPPIQGAGTRLMWYPQKGAFRVGWVEDDRWNKDSIGIFSMAFGHSTLAQNTGSVALGVRTNAKGAGSMATGWGSSANANYSHASGFFSTANGVNSTAIGTGALTSNHFAISIGNNTVASGNTAVALGDSSIASGSASLAAGSYVTAKGRASVTLGGWNDNTDNPDPLFSTPTDRIFQLGNGNAFLATRSNALTVLRNGHTGIGITDPRFPLSFGTGNGDKISLYDDGNPAQVNFGLGINNGQLLQIHSATSFDDIAFGYGKSSSFTERMRIKGNGKVGINTSSPLAFLHVADSSVVFTAIRYTGLGTPQEPPPVEGPGVRMMWYPRRSAFRVGEVNGDQWDKVNIGRYSFAAGNNTKATGPGSVAMGQYTTSVSEGSTALGYNTTASGGYATSMGNGAIASGSSSLAVGLDVNASGWASVAMGRNVFARAMGSLTVGAYNDDSDTPDPHSPQPTDRLFQIGNGGTIGPRKNAITILRNGNIGIGTVTPAKQTEIIGEASITPVTLVIGNRGAFGPAAIEFISDYGTANQWRPGYLKSNDLGGFTGALGFYTNGAGFANLYGEVKGLEVRNGATYTATGTVSSWSDTRLKKEIQPFHHGLDIISKITPVRFFYNEASPFQTDKAQVGVLAQDLEKIAPFMVDKNSTKEFDDLRSVNNQAYTFLLINAVKELQQELLKQQQQIEELKRILKNNK